MKPRELMVQEMHYLPGERVVSPGCTQFGAVDAHLPCTPIQTYVIFFPYPLRPNFNLEELGAGTGSSAIAL